MWDLGEVIMFEHLDGDEVVLWVMCEMRFASLLVTNDHQFHLTDRNSSTSDEKITRTFLRKYSPYPPSTHW